MCMFRSLAQLSRHLEFMKLEGLKQWCCSLFAMLSLYNQMTEWAMAMGHMSGQFITPDLLEP